MRWASRSGSRPPREQLRGHGSTGLRRGDATQKTFFLAAARIFLSAALPLAAETAPFWQTEWEATLREAEREGKVTFYGLGESDFVTEFQKKYPKIKVTVVSARGGELLWRIMIERRAGKYLVDVGRIGPSSSFGLYRAEVLQPMSPAFILPEVKDEGRYVVAWNPHIEAIRKVVNEALTETKKK